METPSLYRHLADAVLGLHLALVLFVVAGLPLIVVGHRRGWAWTSAWGFRLVHLATIGVVAAEAWLGIVCPLTTLEMWLRREARAVAYEGGFVEHWLQAVLFWQAPSWVFTAVYTTFGLAVAAAWWRFPPRRLTPSPRP